MGDEFSTPPPATRQVQRRPSTDHASAPVVIPESIERRVRALCLALPEVTLRVDESRSQARSTAHSFDIRHRSFCLLVATKGPTGKPVLTAWNDPVCLPR
jgi:hypothetical protein